MLTNATTGRAPAGFALIRGVSLLDEIEMTVLEVQRQPRRAGGRRPPRAGGRRVARLDRGLSNVADVLGHPRAAVDGDERSAATRARHLADLIGDRLAVVDVEERSAATRARHLADLIGDRLPV